MATLNTVLVLCAAVSVFFIWMGFYPENVHFLSNRIDQEEEDNYSIIPNAKTLQTKVAIPIARRLARFNKRRVSRNTLQKIDLDLKAAGLPFGMTPIEFYNLKFAYGILFGALGAYLAIVDVLPMIVAPVLFIVGLRIPGPWLAKLIKSRQEDADAELPGVLDLLSVCMGAGMTLLGSLSVICERNEGLLIDELTKIKNDIGSGESLIGAFHELTLRIRSKKIFLVYQNVKLSEEYGTPIADKLKLMADTVREDAFELTKQKAAKAAQYVLFPVLLFIFPAVAIVIGGPIALKITS